LIKPLNLLADITKELVSARGVNDTGLALGDETASGLLEISFITRPVRGIAPRRGRLKSTYKGDVVLGGPSNDDEAILVDNAGKQRGQFSGILRKFLRRVSKTLREIIPVELYNGNWRELKWGHAPKRFGV
jgi:hypothetical protein